MRSHVIDQSGTTLIFIPKLIKKQNRNEECQSLDYFLEQIS
jgi:hypothetical protein